MEKGDFGLWKYRMIGQFEIQGLLSVIEEDHEERVVEQEVTEKGKEVKDEPKASSKDPNWEMKDRRARSLLSQCLSNSVLRKIMHEPTAYKQWKTLERDYQTKTKANRIYLKKQFSCFKMDEDKTIEENLDRFLKLINDLESLKVTIQDEDQAIGLLNSLPSIYDPLVTTLQFGNAKDTLTMDDVITGAYGMESNLIQKGQLYKKKNAGESLTVENRGRSENRNNKGNGKGRSKSRGRSQSKGKQGNAAKACWICGDTNHWKKDCPKKGQNKTKESANLTVIESESLAYTVSLITTSEEWVLDSGCTYHITPKKNMLTDLVEFEGNKVYMGNNTHCTVKGIGKLIIRNLDGSTVTLEGVRYVPEMSRNLISYGQFELIGCNYIGEDFKIQFYKEGKKFLSGTYNNGLYYLDGGVETSEANTVKINTDQTEKWHQRLGHMGKRSMETLVKKGCLKREEIRSLSFCDACAMGKTHRMSFQKAKHTSKDILEYIHSDI